MLGLVLSAQPFNQDNRELERTLDNAVPQAATAVEAINKSSGSKVVLDELLVHGIGKESDIDEPMLPDPDFKILDRPSTSRERMDMKDHTVPAHTKLFGVLHFAMTAEIVI
ncbi:hypothetical protein N7510_011158 [Penicillium lagena]|uniref:uncharacterized protein n=1 Tax=Penicillium lagena TaxID=94218 RepID=UPI0025421F35|nr:uncharacterized protein N7510_011158 [Penicillium lagena]KAJ5601624.1 hypothetical protein N7510_011158 [Penicillium lagena]